MSKSASAQPGDRGKSVNPAARAFARALQVFPDGTSRATIPRDPYPHYVSHGAGAHVYGLDGHRWLDLNGNFTTLIHGHAFAPVVEATCRAIERGSCFANPTESEIALAELICSRVRSIEWIRFVNTGTEAVMFAIKAARCFTGRSAIAKVEGAYHGAYDWAEISQNNDATNWGPPERPASRITYRGMPQSVADDVVMLRFNDAPGARKALDEHGPRLAALLIDPMPSRAGLIAPEPQFVEAITAMARRHGFLIVADEVLNFRQSIAGASVLYGIEPDVLALGKIIGGGFPIGAVGGRRDVMDVFAARGTPPAVSQGGTFSANPISMVAGRTTLDHLDEDAFDRLNGFGRRVREGLARCIERAAAPFSVTGAGSLFRIHPKPNAPREFRDAWLTASQAETVRAMCRHFFSRGVMLPMHATACLSTPMVDEDVEMVIDVFDQFLRTIDTKGSAS